MVKSPKGEGGSTRNIHEMGSDGASYCEPKKYTSLKFYTQKNTWHQNILPPKNTRLNYLNTDLFIHSIYSSFFRNLHVADRNKTFARRCVNPPKIRPFFKYKKIRDRSLDPPPPPPQKKKKKEKQYRECKFSTPKILRISRHVFCE